MNIRDFEANDLILESPIVNQNNIVQEKVISSLETFGFLICQFAFKGTQSWLRHYFVAESLQSK